VADVFEIDTHVIGQRRGEHGVLHVVQSAPLQRRRDQVGPQQRQVVPVLVVQGDHVAVDALLEHQRRTTGLDVLAHQGMGTVHGHVAELVGRTVIGHLQAVRIVRVEYRRVAGHLHHHALDLGQVLQRVDALETEVIGGDVQAAGHVGAVVAKAAAQDTAARRLHHRRVHGGIAQHDLRRRGTGHVARDAQPPSMYTPSVLVCPTVKPAIFRMWPACARWWSCRWCR
jgi:hypothetical protein